MNNDTIERWILLKQSGELGPIRAWRLHRALARDPEARRFANDLLRLTEAARAWTLTQPGAHIAEAIHARLQAAPDRREMIVLQPAPAPFRRLAFAAACAALLIGLFVFLRPDDRPTPLAQSSAPAPAVQLEWDDGLDAEIDALFELVATAQPDETARNGAAALDEDQLIREWFALEGIAI